MRRNIREDSCYFWLRIVVFLLFLIGCARVSIESKEPIKLDVTMRLDIYQHVTEDVAAIEDMIASPQTEKKTDVPKNSFLSLGIQEAYAQQEDDFPSEVKEAIERRKARRESLVSEEAEGILGENYSGFVEIRDSSLAGKDVMVLVEEENKDRQLIYQYVAKKNSAGFEETSRIFAKRIQEDAPSGTPIEVSDGVGGLKWVKK